MGFFLSSQMFNLREIIRNSYFHLLILFILAVFLLKISFLQISSLNFVWFAVILGLFGWSLNKKKKPVDISFWLLFLAFFVVVFIRIIPYIGNSVPLGYDPGLYKFVFEHPFGEQWTLKMYPMFFSLVMGGLNLIFGSWFLLVPFFIFLSSLICLILYYVVKRLFNQSIGILAALIFMVSITQFQTFWWCYYKNVLGIILLLFSFLYLDKGGQGFKWKLILIGGLIGGIHRPALFIFGLTFVIYALFQIKKKDYFKNYILNGVAILILVLLFNFDRIGVFLLPQFFLLSGV